jgi:hypothetical protein
MTLLDKIQADNRPAQAAMLFQAQGSRKASWFAAGASALMAIGALVVAIIALRHP